ncbi:UDP-2,4-diacetamido-2,4,6-trideoxy-beta-L-altropyranose hydrolase, partial [Campylobacter jejuni]
LNVNAYAKASDYEGLVPFKCEVRCGFSYALIRDEFYKESKIEREKIWDYFICIGGTDIKNLSMQIASDLPKNKKIAIATSSSNKNLKKLEKFIQNHENVKLFIDEEISKLMNESTKLIISASSLVNEALLLKANFKAVCVAKNQEKLANWLVQKGYEVEYRL